MEHVIIVKNYNRYKIIKSNKKYPFNIDRFMTAET